MVPLAHYLWASAILFTIGLMGLATRRNIILMLLSIEILFNAANVALVAFAQTRGDITGQVLVFFAMIVAAAEITVGLAIAILLFRHQRTLDADTMNSMKW